jgi:NAD(P)H-hydrate epimerase
MDIPAVTAAQMLEVDRLMVQDYHVDLLQMMENAGRNLAELARRLLGGSVQGRRIAVWCGTGNNGGGGMAAARHLHNWGADVGVRLVGDPQRVKDAPARQLRILRALGLASGTAPQPPAQPEDADLVIDALIGFGLSGDPTGEAASAIRRLNESGKPVLALDLPSGLDATNGRPGKPCIRATATLTLALPKSGLLAAEAGFWVGELYLADIGVPPELYAAPSLRLGAGAWFARESIIRLDAEQAGPAERIVER